MLTGVAFLKDEIKIWPIKYGFDSLATILKIDVMYSHNSNYLNWSNINMFFFIIITRYFVIANVIASIYALLLLFLPLDNSFWRFIVIPDVVSINDTRKYDSFVSSLFANSGFGNLMAGCDNVTEYKHISSISHSTCGKKRELSCWLVTNMWSVSQVLWPSHCRFGCWFCRNCRLFTACVVFFLLPLSQFPTHIIIFKFGKGGHLLTCNVTQ